MVAMVRYADRAACPDCGRTVVGSAESCPACGLPLRGPLADELFEALGTADRLIVELRQQAAPPPPPSPPPPPIAWPPPPSGAGFPAYPGPATLHPAPARVRTASIPTILVTVGALCLLIGGAIFLAVAWSALGVAGRTAVLVAVTGCFAALGTWAATRKLRAAAESLFVLAHGLFAFDLLGAASAGWFGDPSGSTLAAIVGVSLTVAAVACTWAVRRWLPLVGTQVIAALGVMVTTLAVVLADTADHQVRLAACVLICLGVAAVAARLAMPALAWCVGAGVAAWGLGLFSASLNELMSSSWTTSDGWATPGLSVDHIWLHGHGWGLVFLVVVFGGLACLRSMPSWLRVGCAGVSALVAAVALTLATWNDGVTVVTIAWLVVGAVAAVICARLAGSKWWPATLGPVAVGVGFALTNLADHAAALLDRLVVAPFSEPIDATLQGVRPEAQPWLLFVSVGYLAGLAFVIGRIARRPAPSAAWTVPTLCGLAAVTGVAVLACYEVPRWVVVLPLALAVLATAADGLRRDISLLAAAVISVPMLAVAAPSQALFAGTLAVVVVCAAAVDGLFRSHRSALDPTEVRQLAAALWAVAGWGLGWTALDLASVQRWHISLALVVVFGALGALWRRHELFEFTAWICAVGGLGIWLEDATRTAISLTVLGAFFALSSVLRADRRLLGWAASICFTLALWIRLNDQGVSTTEWYTLPVAAGLLIFGLVQMRRTDRPSRVLLGPGLAVAIMPSLVIALGDPVSVRALILGVAAAVVLLAGAALKWEAPTLAGAATVVILALAEAVNARVLPQWWTLSIVGACLLAVGVTWEFWMSRAKAAYAWVHRMR